MQEVKQRDKRSPLREPIADFQQLPANRPREHGTLGEKTDRGISFHVSRRR